MFCSENAFAFYNIASAQEGSKEWLEVLTCEQLGWPYYLFIYLLLVFLYRYVLIYMYFNFAYLSINSSNTASKHRELDGKRSFARWGAVVERRAG